jgi:hypothetical protein
MTARDKGPGAATVALLGICSPVTFDRPPHILSRGTLSETSGLIPPRRLRGSGLSEAWVASWDCLLICMYGKNSEIFKALRKSR